MNTTQTTINRSELESIFATLPIADVVWAVKNLTDRIASLIPQAEVRNRPVAVAPEDLKVDTWLSYGMDEATAKSCVRSMQDYRDGNYVSCSTPQEIDALFASL